MEKQYEVTIGLPVYNVEKYMRTTLDSVLAQDFESLEILLCDDCGTDASITIAEEYQQNHARGCDIRIVRQPENKGTGEARNRLIDEARGRYLYFMDADDVIEPNTISLLYNAAKKYDAQAVYGSYERIFIEDGREVKRVEVFNVFGQLLYVAEPSGCTSVQIGVGDFSAGLYYVRVTTGNAAVTKRVVVNR